MASSGQTVRRETVKDCAHCRMPFSRDTRNTWAYWEKAKYCSSACAGAAHSAAADDKGSPIGIEFARWFNRGDGCWEWLGARDRNGYGAFSYAGLTRRAHVVALALDGRGPAKGQYACHHCDNPACVRPDHLYPGTPTQNMADAIARNRQQAGVRHYAAKLTDADVITIRASSDAIKIIAAQYGVSASNIAMIRRRKTWKHVP